MAIALGRRQIYCPNCKYSGPSKVKGTPPAEIILFLVAVIAAVFVPLLWLLAICLGLWAMFRPACLSEMPVLECCQGGRRSGARGKGRRMPQLRRGHRSECGLLQPLRIQAEAMKEAVNRQRRVASGPRRRESVHPPAFPSPGSEDSTASETVFRRHI